MAQGEKLAGEVLPEGFSDLDGVVVDTLTHGTPCIAAIQVTHSIALFDGTDYIMIVNNRRSKKGMVTLDVNCRCVFQCKK